MQCDNKEQLRNIQQLNVVKFTYSPEFSTHVGLVNAHDTGVIAQQVQKILPEAVTTAGSLVLPNGTKFENFLLVDKVGVPLSLMIFFKILFCLMHILGIIVGKNLYGKCWCCEGIV